jgi:DNA-directed RNA polymerase subunit RPC12/RpoP
MEETNKKTIICSSCGNKQLIKSSTVGLPTDIESLIHCLKCGDNNWLLEE